MYALLADDTGHASWMPAPEPAIGLDDVLIEVAAAGVNRADLLQAAGHYPPPPGVSDVLGLECSGRISAVGDRVGRWRVGDEVCALVPGGAQAERVAVPQGLVLPVPAGVSLIDAAGLPEAAATCWSNLVDAGRLTAGDWVLVHGGAGGVGSVAVQLAAALGARVIATAGGAERVATCRRLGAQIAIDHRSEDFVAASLAATEGHGADVILDVIGGAYLARNLDALATDGRLVIIGMQRGARGELDIGRLLAKRASVIGTTLRSRPLAQREAIVTAVEQHVWPLLGSKVRLPIEDRIPITQAASAHTRLAAGGVTGKLILTLT